MFTSLNVPTRKCTGVKTIKISLTTKKHSRDIELFMYLYIGRYNYESEARFLNFAYGNYVTEQGRLWGRLVQASK